MTKRQIAKLEKKQRKVFAEICKLWQSGQKCYALVGEKYFEVSELLSVNFQDNVQPENFVVWLKCASYERVSEIFFE